MTDDLQETKFLEIIEPYIVGLAEVTEITMHRLRKQCLYFFRKSIALYEDFVSRKIWARQEFKDWLINKENVPSREIDRIFDPLVEKEIAARELMEAEIKAKEDLGEKTDARVILFPNKNKL